MNIAGRFEIIDTIEQEVEVRIKNQNAFAQIINDENGSWKSSKYVTIRLNHSDLKDLNYLIQNSIGNI